MLDVKVTKNVKKDIRISAKDWLLKGHWSGRWSHMNANKPRFVLFTNILKLSIFSKYGPFRNVGKGNKTS